MDLTTVLTRHQAWLEGGDLDGRANLGRADLRVADLCGANLGRANLGRANLGRANLRGANLGGANLRGANLGRADLRGANLCGADLRGANLGRANLRGANLRGADLGGADLRGADLSGAKGLLDPTDWLAQNCESTAHGIIAYKTFGANYSVSEAWVIEPGSVLSEVVNPCPTGDCACGINVATLDWERRNNGDNSNIWRCLIRWPWLVSAVIPYHTDGKFRVGRVELVEVVK